MNSDWLHFHKTEYDFAKLELYFIFHHLDVRYTKNFRAIEGSFFQKQMWMSLIDICSFVFFRKMIRISVLQPNQRVSLLGGSIASSLVGLAGAVCGDFFYRGSVGMEHHFDYEYYTTHFMYRPILQKTFWELID